MGEALMTKTPLHPTDGEDSPLIAMTPADAGLYLAGLARAEAQRNKRERNWEGFANLCAYMIQQAYDAGKASASPPPIAVRTFRCGCTEPAIEAVVDAADVQGSTAVMCPACGKEMAEVEG